MDVALQDVLKVHCFGCGALNAQGLQIKSYRIGEDTVCRWRPAPFHIGYPGYVYGGTIASVVDCHAIWTAVADYCLEIGHVLANGPPPFAYVTGKLCISYLKSMSIDGEMELHARVVEKSERKSTVTCSVSQGEIVCASADVVTVRVPALG
jgi:acyl-coenzyme A thioesterase PaaI-like protein